MRKLLLLLLACFSLNAFSQCPFNIGFEQGTTAGWVCKSGAYGIGPCPSPTTVGCPTFLTVDTTIGCLNVNGINALINTGVDRHTIVDSTYYTSGNDPNSVAPHLIHVTDHGKNGKYSFRLGDGVAGGVGPSCFSPPPGCYPRSEAIRLTFNVTAQTALFNYRYVAFLQEPGHWPEEQPAFEILVMKPDSGDKFITGGYTKITAGTFNPSCPGTSGFHAGAGVWKYSDWIDSTLNLSSFIGQKIAIEFRTHDCFPSIGTPVQQCDPVTGCCTTTLNGVSCKDSISGKCSGPPWCTGTLTCSNNAGSHSCYVYLNASCGLISGLEINPEKTFKIYPNPVINSFTIELQATVTAADLSIYDMLGRLQLQKHLTTNKTEIPAGTLKSGAYFARVRIGEWQYTRKLVVE